VEGVGMFSLWFMSMYLSRVVTVKDMTGKSVWRGRHSEEINVETFALQHYEKMGYKG
jgi:hypothetical protein